MEQWTAMESVQKLTEHVIFEIKRLKQIHSNPRVIRQISDGEKFLNMLHSMTYCEAKRIGELRKKISQKRTSLKEISNDISKLLPNYQMSLFEEQEDVSKERSEKLQIQKNIIEEEISWLHKALGICSNKDYFK